MQKLEEIREQIRKHKGKAEFLKTGFPSVDRELDGGFLKKELVVLGASSGIGKSYYAGSLFYQMAKQSFLSAYFSLEISNTMVYSRLVGALSNLKPTRISMGLLDSDEYHRKIEAETTIEVYSPFMSFYDDVYELEKIKEAVRANSYEFVIIDFLQNVVAKGQTEYERLSFIALELQKFAKEQDCCILLLSQLSNQIVREGKSSPGIEYKGSGSIATVCDLGFFIVRPRGDAGEVDLTRTQLILRKNRRGISGIGWNMRFQAPGGYIDEVGVMSE